MMAAYRLRGLGWFGACAAMVLGFYLVSLQVAHERNRLEALNRRIAGAERDIRALETEFDTRANLQQLERWNGDILALSAPTAGQFVRDGSQLASARFDGGGVPGNGGEMRTAALVVPSLPAAAPVMQPVTVPLQAAPVQTVAVATVRPLQVQAAGPATKAVAPAPARTVLAAAKPARPAAARMQRVAMLDGDLLADLTSSARAEASRR